VDSELVDSCYTPAALRALKHFPVSAENVELIAHSENVTLRVMEPDIRAMFGRASLQIGTDPALEAAAREHQSN
jgi:hypothetical protein